MHAELADQGVRVGKKRVAYLMRSRGVPEGGVLHHCDRGSQHASEDYCKALEGYGFAASMSRKDNAASESFFATIKTEMIHHQKFATRQEAKTTIFEYIEVFYNRQRRHSTLGYMSPANYEAKDLKKSAVRA